MAFTKNSILVTFILLGWIFSGCTSTPALKTQAYAQLKQERIYEYDFPVVWKAIEEVFRNYKITDRDPSTVSVVEMRKINERSLRTDWIYARSRDKYEEYEVNNSPRKIYLQTRLRYQIEAKKQLGGVIVTAHSNEEVERIKSDGTSGGYDSVDNPDTSRTHEILEKIKLAILAAGPDTP